MQSNSQQSCSACGAWWRLPVLLVLVLAAILLWHSRTKWEATPQSNELASAESAGVSANEKVFLAIDFGDNRRRDFKPLAWHEGMTVADLLNSTSRFQA